MSEEELIEWFKSLSFEKKGMACLLYSMFFNSDTVERIINKNKKENKGEEENDK